MIGQMMGGKGKKISEALARNPVLLCMVVVIASLMLIPFFILGMAAVWSILFSVLAGFSLRSGLEKIYDRLKNIPENRYKSYIGASLLKLFCALIIVTALPVLIVFRFEMQPVISGLDGFFYRYFSSSILEAENYSVLLPSAKMVLISIMNIPVFSVIFWLFAMKKITILLNDYYRRDRENNKNRSDFSEFMYWSLYDIAMDVSAFLPFAILASPIILDKFFNYKDITALDFLQFSILIFWVLLLPYLFLYLSSLSDAMVELVKSCLGKKSEK